MTAGEQLRDFIDVGAVAARLVEALEFSDLRSGDVEITNIGTGVGTSVRKFCEHWWTQWNARGSLEVGAVPYRSNEMMRLVADTTPYRF
jgi:UDP-glucose 4-epimerase